MNRKPNIQTPLALSSGGTGGTDASSARLNLEAADSSHAHNFSDISGVAALNQGGTGATTPATARANLGVASANHTHTTADISGVLPPAHGGTGLSSFGPKNSLLISEDPFTLKLLPPGTSGDVLTWDGNNGDVGWQPPPPYTQGMGVKDQVAVWNQSGGDPYLDGYSALTFSSGGILRAPEMEATSGVFSSQTSTLDLEVYGGTPQLRLANSKSYLYNVRTLSGGSALYRTSSGELCVMSSLAAHKENVQDIETTIEDLMGLRPVEFDWTPEHGGGRDIGLIAEEVAEKFPLAANYDLPADDAPAELSGVKYDRAWLYMLAGLQDFYRKYQSTEDELNQKILELKGRLARLES